MVDQARLDGVGIEVLSDNDAGGALRVSDVGIEVLSENDVAATVRLGGIAVEVLSEDDTAATVRLGGIVVEVMSSLGGGGGGGGSLVPLSSDRSLLGFVDMSWYRALLALFASAQSWYSSKDGGQGQEIGNRNGTGDAVLGSSSLDTNNDPTFLDHTGEDYVWTPGNAGNDVYAADQASFDVSGNLTIQARLTFHATNGVFQFYRDDGGSDRWCYFTLANSGQLQWRVNTDGGAHFYQSQIPAEYRVTGQELEVQGKVEFAGGNATLSVWYRLVGDTTWIQVGSDSVQTGTAMAASSQDIHVGGNNLGTSTGQGRIYWVKMYDDDTLVASFDAAEAEQTSWASSTGETWTVNRSTSGLKTAVVTRPVYLFDGVDDYLQLPASDTPTFTATTGKHTVVVAGTSHDAAAEYVFGLYASQSGSQGLTLYLHNNGWTRTDVQGSSSSVTAYANIVATAGEPFVIAAVVDDGTVASYMDNGSASGLNSAEDITGVGTISMSDPYIGYRPSASQYCDAEFFDVLSFPGVALTETELDLIADRLKAGTYSAD